MLFELPLDKASYDRIIKFEEMKQERVVLFQLEHKEYPETLFVLIHGNEEGLVSIGGTLVSPKMLLEILITKADLKSRGITEVLTISCHGGLQKSAEVDGITIKSMHESHDQIYCKAQSTLDDEYFLEVVINEALEEGIAMSYVRNETHDEFRDIDYVDVITDEYTPFLEDIRTMDEYTITLPNSDVRLELEEIEFYTHTYDFEFKYNIQFHPGIFIMQGTLTLI